MEIDDMWDDDEDRGLEARAANSDPARKPYVSPHEDGWYWVRKKGWIDEFSDWIPALWQTEYRSWRSAMFSGIPDSEMIVGGMLKAPSANSD